MTTDFMDLLGGPSSPPRPAPVVHDEPAAEGQPLDPATDGPFPPFPYTEEQTAWLDLLETTGLPQTQRALRNPEGFCCLGVRLHQVDPEGWAEDPDSRDRYAWRTTGEKKAGSALAITLPQTEWQALHLRDGAGRFWLKDLTEADVRTVAELGDLPDRSHGYLIANLNDKGWTFRQIAAFIRRNPNAVFTNGANPEKEEED